MKYKLIDVIDQRTRFYVKETSASGAVRHAPIYLEPGKTYETDDKILASSLSGADGTIKTRYREDLEASLKELGADYEVSVCKVCGGKKKFIVYHAVEVVE